MRFYQLLHRVVRNPAFHPDAMSEYMLKKFQLSSAYDAEDFRVKAIDRLNRNAAAVFDYLAMTGQL